MLIGQVAYRPEAHVVVFLRVPKTGSSSLSAMLAEAFGEAATARLADRQADNLNHGFDRARDQLRRFGMRRRDSLWRGLDRLRGRGDRMAEARFLHGHHPIWAALPTRREPLYIMTTRDPVDRFLSFYYHVRAKAERGGGNPLKRLVLAEEPDAFARRVLRSPAARRLNGMCLYLARSGRFEEAEAVLRERVFAAAPLERIGAFGVALAGAFGLPPPAQRRENVNRGRPAANPLSPAVEAELRAALEPDRRLHDHVTEQSARFLT